MKTIKTTQQFANLLQSAQWVIINEDYAVGAYATRTEARNAKAEENLAGQIVKANEIDWVVLGEDLGMSTTRCPNCGSEELFTGEAPHGQVINEDKVIGCHHCDWEYRVETATAPKAAPKKTISRKGESTTDHPCKRVWHIADEMTGAKRKDVLAACVAAGVTYYTARTQYQAWLGVQKEMAAREAQNGK